ncbi:MULTISPECIES: LysR family transcriptional regulator [Pseudomonas]|uniref:Transcriptional regulator n=1 Tax=Pseudomonas asplenii TaxID=53407 RepID=A0A0M9GF06_9PSED|nr:MULTISPECIES: LysR family transcriptional regulator [Pseudomonas]KPA89372.1 transcriptional regulator [Pseudomonas fuscovaginae]KPA99557.1 transcriptional regulator [Pseudomonas fuscovaginae]
MQYQVTHSDLHLVLALVRGRTLARAAEQLQVDVSTVFRAIRKLEANLEVALFDKNRRGYTPTESAKAIAEQAERAEQALETARIALAHGENVISGTVRLTCTDAVLRSLLLPGLSTLMPRYPAISLEIATSNNFASLSRRDADIALRLSNSPPEHLVGRRLGKSSYFVCGHASFREGYRQSPTEQPWIAPNDSLAEHISVVWRQQVYPGLVPRYRCSSMSSVGGLVGAGLGVAALPDFMVNSLEGVERLSGPLEGCDTDIWLLTRPDNLSLRSVQILFDEMANLLRGMIETGGAQ